MREGKHPNPNNKLVHALSCVAFGNMPLSSLDSVIDLTISDDEEETPSEKCAAELIQYSEGMLEKKKLL